MTIPKIHTYSSPAHAFLVNSFLIETLKGVILVDTQFLVSEARKLKEAIQKINKPLLGIIITHPHPDHFNGTVVIAEGINDLPIYATQATLHGIKASEASKRNFWTKTYGSDYPQSTTFPNQIVESNEPLMIDGLEIVIDDLGAGESSDITVIYLPQTKTLIASDLVYNKVHPWLAESRSQAWLEQIQVVKAKYKDAQTVFAGHGTEGNLSIIDEQAEYINTFRQLVADRLQGNGEVSLDSKASIRKDLIARYQNYPLDSLIESNLDGVVAELSHKLA